MASLTEHLVGRSDELAALEMVLAEVDRDRAAAVEIVGEPGIGKTRLLAELAARADARGWLVLTGSGTELERGLPFSVLLDALDDYLRGLDPSRLAVIDEDARAELASVFPSLSALGRRRVAALQQERYRSHRAVRVLLEQLAETRPLLLALDDFHWADSASVELLGALLHRPPGAAVLTAVALRPRQMPERLAAALGRAHRAATLTRIELEALTPADAGELLAQTTDARTIDDADARTLYAESGGNPFYLEQLARSLQHPGRAVPAPEISPAGIGVPSAVAASLSEELALLSAGTRLVIEGAAVAGDPFEVELAAAAAATSESTAIDAIDELLRLDLIRTTDVPRRFRFRHPLVGRAVYEATAGGWRLKAHERCAEALVTRGAAAAARAHHVERSARQGDPAAIAVLSEAGEAAVRLAPASAAHWFGAALRLLPETAPSEERLVLLLARARSLAATGHFAESRSDLLDCLAIMPKGAGARRVHVTTACATTERLLGLREEAHAHVTTALAELGDEESPEGVALMIELTVDAIESGEIDATSGWAARAVAASTVLRDPILLAAALAVGAWAGAFAGDVERAHAYCGEATRLIDELSDDELARRLDALAHLASAEVYLDRFTAAARHARRALAIGRATGQGDFFPVVVVMLGVSLWVRGRPLEAGELFDGAIDAARLAGNGHSLAWNLLNRSFAAIAAADLDTARATAEESFELVGDAEPGLFPALAAATLAYALLEQGQADASVDLLLTRVGGEELQLIPGSWRARFLELLTRALLASGKRAEAERAVEAAQACADAVRLPSATAMAKLAAAALALEAGEASDAAERALAAATAFEAVGGLFDAARARELAGRALARAGDPELAALEFERAAAAFDSFGSIRYRNRAERELRRLGRRIHRRTRPGKVDETGIMSLTQRELEVARLVVERKTNPEIAAQLFLSLKTVESHLRHIFGKLNVSSRVELARAVERAGNARRPPATRRLEER